MQSKLLEAGKIVSVHGLHGEVKLQPWCDSAAFACGFKTLYRYDGTPIAVERARPQKDMAILKLAGCETLEAANALRHTVLYFRREDAVLEPGTYFISDLVGLQVVDADTGQAYGVLDEVLQTGANDVYAVKNGEKTLLVPAIPDVVLETDPEAGVMKIRPLKGLFDDAD